MPSYPKIDKGEGFIRSHELLEQLHLDIGLSYQFLEQEGDSQYLRRCVVRTIFSYIDAQIETVKVELRSTIRMKRSNIELTPKEKEFLGALSPLSNRKNDKQFPIDENIKRTFRLAAKIWELTTFSLSTGGREFIAFLQARDARNRLTHPKTYYDIQVTDDDLHNHTTAYHWIHLEFERLLLVRLEAIAKSLPPEVGERLLKRWESKQ